MHRSMRPYLLCVAALSWIAAGDAVVSLDIPGVDVTTMQLTFPYKCRAWQTIITPQPVAYGPTPILVKFSENSQPGNTTIMEARFEIRGLDNQLPSGSSQAFQSYEYLAKCSPDGTTWEDSKSTRLNVTVFKTPPRAPAWVRSDPGPISVPCMQTGQLSTVNVPFKHPSDGFPEALQADWKAGSLLPWVSSRPSKAMKKKQVSGEEVYERDRSDIIIRSIKLAEGSGGSVIQLGLIPPRGDATWTVCFYPGDDYNYYEEVCTEPFEVRDALINCPAEPEEGSSSSDSSSMAWWGWLLVSIGIACCLVPLFAMCFCGKAAYEICCDDCFGLRKASSESEEESGSDFS